MAKKPKTEMPGGKPALVDAPPAVRPLNDVNSASASDAEFAAYITAQYEAHRGLGEAVALLKTRFKLTGDPDERRAINHELGGLEEKLQNIEAERTAFMAGQLLVQPPSDEDVENLKEIANRLDELIAKSTTASAILGLVNELAGIWRQSAKK